MKPFPLTFLALLAATFAGCSTTQERVSGAATGAGVGAIVAGPVGAVVGGAVGAATGPAVARGAGVPTRRARRP